MQFMCCTVLVSLVLLPQLAHAACTETQLTPADHTRAASSPTFSWTGDCVEHRVWTWPAGAFAARTPTAWYPGTSFSFPEDVWDAKVAGASALMWAVEGRGADGTVGNYSARWQIQVAHDDDDDGQSLEGGDCDDLDAGIYPGAGDVCGDGVDADCDGSDACHASIAGTHPVDVAETKVVGLLADDDVGYSVALDDLDGDGRAEILIAAAGGGSVYQGAAFVLDDPGPGVSTIAIATASIDGGETPMAVSAPGDLDCDGVRDLYVGVPDEDVAFVDQGAGYLMRGPLAGPSDVVTAWAKVAGTGRFDEAGYVSPHGVGDLDGDGCDDLVVGAPFELLRDPGTAYLLAGPIPAGQQPLASAPDTEFDAARTGSTDDIGASPRSTDWNADGLPDLVLDAPEWNGAGVDRGAVLVLASPQPVGVRVDAEDIAVAAVEGADGDFAATGYATPGDLDGDGIGDLAIGAPYADTGGADAGVVYLVHLDPTVTGLVSAPSAAWATLIGEDAGDLAGSMVTEAGDFDGDGFADLALTAREDAGQGYHAGVAYIVLGPFAGAIDLSTAAAKLVGPEDNSAGEPIAIDGGRDVDGDGLPDVVVGSWADGPNREGAVWVFYGGSL